MFYGRSLSRKIFEVFNYIFLTLLCIACMYPILNTLAISLSSKDAINAGQVSIWPVGLQFEAYLNILQNVKFTRSFIIAVERLVLGVGVNMLLTILVGYPMSKSTKIFPARNYFMWYFFITMLFSGGLIPGYLVVKNTGILNTIWALILPGALPVSNAILLQNYFKGLPDELYDSARLDGANEMQIMWKIMLPLSKPVLSTLVVFTSVNHWNAWFDGILYMNRSEKYPLQSYLKTIIVDIDPTKVEDLSQIMNLTPKNNRAAQIFVAMIPILCVYPYLQKYFTKGITLGSVKG